MAGTASEAVTSAASSAEATAASLNQTVGSSAEGARTLRSLLTETQLREWRSVRAAVEPTLDALAREFIPKAKINLLTPEQAVEQAIRDSDSCSVAVNSATAEAEVSALRASLELLKGTDAPEVKAMRDLLGRKEAALVKTNKAVPSLELELKGLMTAQSKFEELMQLRADRVKTTAEAAKKRREERHNSLLEMRQQMALNG